MYVKTTKIEGRARRHSSCLYYTTYCSRQKQKYCAVVEIWSGEVALINLSQPKGPVCGLSVLLLDLHLKTPPFLPVPSMAKQRLSSYENSKPDQNEIKLSLNGGYIFMRSKQALLFLISISFHLCVSMKISTAFLT
jgi:hypothetical protein